MYRYDFTFPEAIDMNEKDYMKNKYEFNLNGDLILTEIKVFRKLFGIIPIKKYHKKIDVKAIEIRED